MPEGHCANRSLPRIEPISAMGFIRPPPATQGNEPAKLKAIAAALRTFDEAILATDCDLGYRRRVRRALLTAQDPKTLQKAFARLKPNVEVVCVKFCKNVVAIR
jgi:hypothetical protein